MTTSETLNDDMFDGLFNLEDQFYAEGYHLGAADGEKAGNLEGRAIGIEKGFDKYVEMAKLHGRAKVWSGRLDDNVYEKAMEKVGNDASGPRKGSTPRSQTILPGARLESHVKTLYALSEPESISTENNEEAVAAFDDRLRRAEGKMKVIEKIIGESAVRVPNNPNQYANKHKKVQKRDSNIEDVNILSVRH